MAKGYGMVGFAITEETSPGIWEDRIIERGYAYEKIQSHTRWNNDGNLNDNVVLTTKLSIVADDFATRNLPKVKYVNYRGNKYAVTMVDDQYPRYVLSLGGLYNG